MSPYSGELNKVAVMTSGTVFDTDLVSFNWNEKKLKPGVFIFDIDTEEGLTAFIQCLSDGAD